ncbi:hypothetical protein [Candidatus Vallotiella sp. (ex Adelges kitamiensis)]|uniref:hypothetical protein n=1 Tax=Candidatus Vallotiella sp. (ex Adelges kitamiensis) TaxID=2864217 RepID=UPI00403E26F1
MRRGEKNPNRRRKLIKASDVILPCLPDAASLESMSLVESDRVIIIDASTAFRIKQG